MAAAPAIVALVNYGMGNLRSVEKALQAAGARVRVVADASGLAGADAMVLPGVGALEDCIAALKAAGLVDAICGWIREDRPFLGVCLGLQALFESSEEAGARGLGVFPGRVLRFRRPPEFKVPHMGWNAVRFTQPGGPLSRGLEVPAQQFYFVHSYHACPEDPSLVLAETDYGGPFVSAIARGRCFATQFHPEKSQAAGIALYRNFVDLARVGAG